MAGESKARVGTRKAEKFKDGLKKSGGVKTQRHAGPGRASTSDRDARLAAAKEAPAMSL
jgi:hypothetical protein